jgi:hypothetical protein
MGEALLRIFAIAYTRRIAPKYSASLGTSTSTEYRATFFKANAGLEGKVVVIMRLSSRF